MKRKNQNQEKLNFAKMKISKLNNLHSIKGGSNGVADNGSGDNDFESVSEPIDD